MWNPRIQRILYCSVSYKEFEHLRILVSAWGGRVGKGSWNHCQRILRANYIWKVNLPKRKSCENVVGLPENLQLAIIVTHTPANHFEHLLCARHSASVS